MAPTINVLGNTGGYYAQQNVSTLANYESAIEFDIYNHYPVVIAAHENASYNLNSIEIGWYHWYVVRGYGNAGATSDAVDPASGIWSVPQYDSPASSAVQGMMSNGGFGYVW